MSNTVGDVFVKAHFGGSSLKIIGMDTAQWGGTVFSSMIRTCDPSRIADALEEIIKQPGAERITSIVADENPPYIVEVSCVGWYVTISICRRTVVFSEYYAIVPHVVKAIRKAVDEFEKRLLKDD